MAKRASFGNIQKLPSGRYRARFKKEGRWVNAPGTFIKKTEADQWLHEQSYLLARGEWTPSEKAKLAQRSRIIGNTVTIREYADTWLERLEKDGKSPNTIRSYRSNLRANVLPYLGDKPIAEIDRKIMQEWADTLKSEKGRWPLKNSYLVLSSLLHDAQERGIVEGEVPKIKNAAAKIISNSDLRERVASDEQVEQIAAAMPHRLQIMVFIGAWAGLRYSEIAGLQRKHIDLKERIIKVRQAAKRTERGETIIGGVKSAKSRRDVPINSRLSEMLENHLEIYCANDPEALIVHSNRNTSKPVSNSTLHRHYDKAVIAAGLPKFTFHQLRATCATRLARAGATPAEIQTILGHASLEIGAIYQRAPRERLQQIMDQSCE